ncbi:MAG: TRAP transporter small permease [Gammaproteobacteria bacterium]|nr:TRAP transporter small permease [Gammaproteobacteria bacterium]MCY4210055.1 TRAP transporter small permease [Gammaproteobacteria bacterium]MCY4281521.1 TRAP transporter small permease [Gammaproteobacteria bacterium]MCY4337415.1 TRAP transporter small permease [Gammaproteobacteria bacterium]
MAERFLHTLGRVERVLTSVAFAVLIAAIFLDVFSREITGVGLHWARQAGVYANIVVVMFGLGLASAGGNHLRPRFADNWLPARWNPVIVRLQNGLMSAFCLLAAGAGAVVTWDSVQLGERSTLLPVLIWPLLAVIPLAFLLVALRHAIYACKPTLAPPDPLRDPSRAQPDSGADD